MERDEHVFEFEIITRDEYDAPVGEVFIDCFLVFRLENVDGEIFINWNKDGIDNKILRQNKKDFFEYIDSKDNHFYVYPFNTKKWVKHFCVDKKMFIKKIEKMINYLIS
jgi:hypothetical protein